MSPFIQCRKISKAFGSKNLFTDITVSFFEGDRVGLIGPNGSGKSTLMKILSNLENPDVGEVIRRSQVRVSYIPQNFLEAHGTIFETVEARLESVHADERTHKAQKALSMCGFNDFEVLAESLSGGWRRRLDIASAIAEEPDLLLLDEPTNHLDIESIVWLENLLKSRIRSYVMVSHDRVFLEKTTNKTIELNRTYPKGLFEIDANYSSFLEKREEFLESELSRKASLTSRVRKEIAWLRQGAKARTTKQQARVKEAEGLQEELSQLKSRTSKRQVEIDLSSSGIETRKLIQAKGISKSHGGRELFSGLDILIGPKTRLGLVGPNGSGKTTLLKILAGEEKPDSGTIKFAPYLKITYFDQKRAKISENQTLKQALGDGREFVEFRGHPIHVHGWAKRFLFETERLDLPLSRLSGGEKARLHIARLMLQPADVLLLDEPTNDLDIDTLEILEETFDEYDGAVVLITHDRLFLNRVTTSLIGLGTDLEMPYFADYDQYEIFKAENKEKVSQAKAQAAKPKAKKALSYKEGKELEVLPQEIEKLEAELEQVSNLLNSGSGDLIALSSKAGSLQDEINKRYVRWEELEKLK